MIDAASSSRLRRRRGLALAIAGVVACAALAGCSGGSRDDRPDSSGGSVTARDVEPGASVSTEKIPQLDVGVLGQIATLSPMENIASGLYTNSLLVESLLRIDAEGKLAPWLAAKHEQVSDTVYEYTLREGVTFWDGSELTSEDVKYSWDLRLSGGSSPQPFFAPVAKIEAPDKYTVRVTLTKPNVTWKYTPALFYSNVFSKAFHEKNKEKFGQPGTLVMATGPWKVDSFNPTTGMELTAYEGYWGGEPAVGRISVKSFADDNSMALALRAGDIDLAPFVNGPRGFDAAAGSNAITTVPTCATALLSMPTQKAPWDDIQVRRAVAYALDREDVIAATQGRAGGPLDTLISPILLQGLGTEEEVEAALDSVRTYPHDLEKAKEELAQSKVPDGFKDKLVIDNTFSSIAQVIAAQLKEIGIELEIEALAATEYGALITGPVADRPLTFTETGACSPDPSWDDLFLGKDGALNIAGWTPPDVDKLLADGLATDEPAERLDIYTSILRRLGEDVPYVPLYAEGTTYASTEYDIVEYDSYYLNAPWALNVVRE